MDARAEDREDMTEKVGIFGLSISLRTEKFRLSELPNVRLSAMYTINSVFWTSLREKL